MYNVKNYMKDIKLFLSLFDLTFKEDLLENDCKLSLFDRDGNIVGTLHHDYDVRIIADIGKNSLDATYVLPEKETVVDYDEERDYSCHEYHQSDFDFYIDKNDGTYLVGDVVIDAVFDNKLGDRLRVYPTVRICTTDDKKMGLLEFNNDLTALGYVEKTDDKQERICISPLTKRGEYISHDFIDEDKRETLSAAVFPKAADDEETVCATLMESKNNSITNYESSEKVLEPGVSSVLVKGKMMQAIDPSMYSKIKEIRRNLCLDGINLFDSMLSISSDLYLDDEIEALFGVERKPSSLLKEGESLQDYYFGDNTKGKKLERELKSQ